MPRRARCRGRASRPRATMVSTSKFGNRPVAEPRPSRASPFSVGRGQARRRTDSRSPAVHVRPARTLRGTSTRPPRIKVFSSASPHGRCEQSVDAGARVRGLGLAEARRPSARHRRYRRGVMFSSPPKSPPARAPQSKPLQTTPWCRRASTRTARRRRGTCEGHAERQSARSVAHA